MEKKVLCRERDARAERLPVPSGNRAFYEQKTLVYQGNTEVTQMRLGMCWLEPGQEVGRHGHNCDEILYVLEGKGTFVVGGEKYEAGPGDLVYVPPDAIHGGHKNTGDKFWRYLFIVGQVLQPLDSCDVCLPSGENVKPQLVKEVEE